MLANKVILREANEGDLEEITGLMPDLGYPATLPEMQARFKNIFAHPDYHTILAVTNSEIVGVAGVCKGIFYEYNGMYLRVLIFVVKQNRRKQGIGKILIEAVEAYAKELQLNTVLINSGNRDARIAAHAFYTQMGYVIKSSGFVKNL